MSVRRLVIDVDADDFACGACHRRRPPAEPGRPSTCSVFGVALSKLKGRVDDGQPVDSWRRLTGCLAAESAARPWEGADDDDPMPDHLRATERT